MSGHKPSMACYEHDDLSIGDEDADEIEWLNEQLQTTFTSWQEEKESWRQELAESQRNDQYSMKLLAESQAREAKLREALDIAMVGGDYLPVERAQLERVLTIPADDTALKEAIKQAKREALLEAAEAVIKDAARIGSDWVSAHHADTLRKMAREIK